MKIDIDDNQFQALIAETIRVELHKILDSKEKDTHPEQNEFLTRQAAADFLKCSLVSLYNYEKRGTLIPLRLGRKILYSKSELIKAMSCDKRNRSP